jgi:hypothetical protein
MLADWHDFYLVLATASGTLISAKFVVASIAGRVVRKARAEQIGLFITATVFHLSIALLISTLVMVPTLTRPVFGVLAGIGGLGFASRSGFWIRRASEIEGSDRIWYAAIPVIGYTLVVVAAALIVDGRAAGLDALALALGLLVAAGIRNAWDMIIFIVGQGENAP